MKKSLLVTLLCCSAFGATTVTAGEPSAGERLNTGKLAPGAYVENLSQRVFTEGYVLQPLTDRTYWVTVGAHNALFYVGDKGVIVFDPLSMGWGDMVGKAIAGVTDLPVTALVYSHFHVDHIADASLFVNRLPAGQTMRIIASAPVEAQAKRYATSVPLPNEVLQGENASFEFEGLTVEAFLTGDGHSQDNTMFLLKQEKVLHYVDVIDPGSLIPFFGLGSIWSEAKNLEDSLQRVLTLDWEFLSAGHDNVGSKKDVERHLEMIADIRQATITAQAQEPFGKFVDPALPDILIWVANQRNAIVARAMEQLRPKYGHLPRFEPLMPSHIGVIAEDLGGYVVVE